MIAVIILLLLAVSIGNIKILSSVGENADIRIASNLLVKNTDILLEILSLKEDVEKMSQEIEELRQNLTKCYKENDDIVANSVVVAENILLDGINLSRKEGRLESSEGYIVGSVPGWGGAVFDSRVVEKTSSLAVQMGLLKIPTVVGSGGDRRAFSSMDVFVALGRTQGGWGECSRKYRLLSNLGDYGIALSLVQSRGHCTGSYELTLLVHNTDQVNATLGGIQGYLFVNIVGVAGSKVEWLI